MNSYKTVDHFGNIRWYKVGTSLLHREDGPAIEFVSGTKHWFIDDKHHRDDGPAIEYRNGDKEWYLNGMAHREDGPACEYIDGQRFWFIHGKYIRCKNQKEFLRLIKLKAFW